MCSKKIQYRNSVTCLAVVLLFSCTNHNEEKEKLADKLDSVSHELKLTKQAMLDAKEVDILLDSIDASRKVMGNAILRNTDSRHTITRLQDINAYVKDINLKMDEMEKSIRHVNTLASSILKLRADIEARTTKISQLEADASQIERNNKTYIQSIQHKDSALQKMVSSCLQDVATLQATMETIHVQNNLAAANLYYKQAESLISLASNLKPASRRKTIQTEALEMYRMSLSLGKTEAQQKIAHLEKEL